MVLMHEMKVSSDHLVAEFTDIDGNPRDISDYIRFDVVSFLTSEVVVVYIDPLPDDAKYLYYKGNAYQRLVSGDSKIPGIKAVIADDTIPPDTFMEEEIPMNTEPEIIEEEQTIQEEINEEPEEIKPAFQQLYSAELITIFGSDYISLEPDLKQMLAYIYERNMDMGANKFPNADEIGDKLWALKGGIGSAIELDLHKKKVKKTLFLMEKNDMIIRIKATYRLNTGYEVVKNLFN